MKKVWKKILSAAISVAAACSVFAAPVSAAWVQDNTGWWYQNTDGSYPHSGWTNIDGVWYLFDGAGYMLTGWQQVDGVWYYLKDWGGMATGWTQVDGSWYYLSGSGAMQTGWLDLGGSRYYLGSSGAMATGTRNIDGKTYTFSSSGVLTGTASGSPSGSANTGSSAAPDEETEIVYWGKTGTKYHRDEYCRSFKGRAANSGTIEEAIAAGRTGWCKLCS